ncbi:hypothetical protein B0T14DRAFT_208145 [Immersiella caudata]|uniref:Uncharacterized protein n=1 Tax=Immersiella caudata TaxID=314043 RepID=A0AA39WPX5_9PEZI|nr:hypothetical protein B0T14DRAFT_208145 [Immersiella caudata]
MFPSLHQDVMMAVSKSTRHGSTKRAATKTPKRNYSTNVMGKFKFNNDGCPTAAGLARR